MLLYNNKGLSEEEIKKTILFSIASKTIKVIIDYKFNQGDERSVY